MESHGAVLAPGLSIASATVSTASSRAAVELTSSSRHAAETHDAVLVPCRPHVVLAKSSHGRTTVLFLVATPSSSRTAATTLPRRTRDPTLCSFAKHRGCDTDLATTTRVAPLP